MMVATFQANPFNIPVVPVYAPTADSSEEDLELFYVDLIKAVKEIPKRDVLIIVGD
jgi:hypothetical protein